MAKLFAIFLLVISASSHAQATVCHAIPNPCQNAKKSEADAKKCAEASDFIFEAEVNFVRPVEITKYYGKEVVFKEDEAGLKISKWIKGSPTNLIDFISYTTDGSDCSTVNTIEPELTAGMKLRFYGAYLNSKNFCDVYSRDEESKKSCVKARHDGSRHYWLIDKVK